MSKKLLPNVPLHFVSPHSKQECMRRLETNLPAGAYVSFETVDRDVVRYTIKWRTSGGNLRVQGELQTWAAGEQTRVTSNVKVPVWAREKQIVTAVVAVIPVTMFSIVLGFATQSWTFALLILVGGWLFGFVAAALMGVRSNGREVEDRMPEYQRRAGYIYDELARILT